MTKLQFLFSLRDKLSDLPQAELEDRLNFYCEMIEDRIEEGLSEEEAVAGVGTIDEIAAQITANATPAKPKSKKQFKVWGIILLALCSPVLLSLLIAAFAVIVSVYASVWAIIVSLWAVFISLVASSFGIFIASICFLFTDFPLTGVAMIGAAFVIFGVSLFLFFGCKAATSGTTLLTRKIAVWVKNRFSKQEDAE